MGLAWRRHGSSVEAVWGRCGGGVQRRGGEVGAAWGGVAAWRCGLVQRCGGRVGAALRLSAAAWGRRGGGVGAAWRRRGGGVEAAWRLRGG